VSLYKAARSNAKGHKDSGGSSVPERRRGRFNPERHQHRLALPSATCPPLVLSVHGLAQGPGTALQGCCKSPAGKCRRSGAMRRGRVPSNEATRVSAADLIRSWYSTRT